MDLPTETNRKRRGGIAAVLPDRKDDFSRRHTDRNRVGFYTALVADVVAQANRKRTTAIIRCRNIF